MTAKTITKKESDVSVEQSLPVYKPVTDVYELGNAVVIQADMPGVDEKHVDVELDNHVLTISGKRVPEEESGMNPLHQGYRAVNYERSFRLGSSLDLENIKARMKNGVLTVELAKAPETMAKKIEVVPES